MNRITEIFCSIDDFCKEFVPFWQKSLLCNGKKRVRSSKMSLSEVITIQVLFHLSGYKTLKEFYLGYVSNHLQKEFSDLFSYNWMVALKRDSFMPLAIYLKTFGFVDCSGISFIDSTALRVCDRRIIHQHKTFKDIAQTGQCSLGWFYGLSFISLLMILESSLTLWLPKIWD